MAYDAFGNYVPDDAVPVDDMRHELLAKNKTPQFIRNLEAMYQLLPGSVASRSTAQGVKPMAETTATLGSSLAAPFLGAAKGVGQNILQGTNERVDRPELAEQFTYQPRTQVGQNYIENLMGALDASKLPPYVAHAGQFRFTPDDLRVAGKTAVSDVRNFPNDFANARAGLQREYPTLGSRVAGGVDIAETANQTLNKAILAPSDFAVQKITGNPLATSIGVVNELGQFNPLSQAVKPKGGNWPTSLARQDLPLMEQGNIGAFLEGSKLNEASTFKNWREQLDELGYSPEWYDFLRSNNAEDISFADPRYPNFARRFTDIINDKSKTIAQLSPEADPIPTIKPLEEIKSLAKAYNKWIAEGPHKKYITTQMGTGVDTDPVLKAIDEANVDPFGIRPRESDVQREIAKRNVELLRGRYERAKQYSDKHPDRPDMFPPPETNLFYPGEEFNKVGELTSKTPAGQLLENRQDFYIQNNGYQYDPTSRHVSENIKEDFPFYEKLKQDTPVYDSLTVGSLGDLGLDEIQSALLKKLTSGEISPEKLPNVSVDSIVRDMIKTKQEELIKAQKSKELYNAWRQKNHEEIPADLRFTDDEGNPTGDKMVVFDADMAEANPDLVIRNLSQDTKDLNHCVGSCGHGTAEYPNRHVPMVEPHTGTTPKGSDASYGPNYIRKIKNGDIQIASLRGPNGESKATLEMQKDFNKDGEVIYGIKQIKGEGNGALKPEDVDLVKRWLNNKGSQIKDNRISDLDNLPGVVDLRNTQPHEIADIYETIHPDKLNNFFGYLIDKKLEGNELGKERYASGYLSPFELMSDEVPRFVTVDDLRKVAEKNGYDIERRPEDTKTTGVKTNGLNDMDRLILEMEINTFLENQRLPDDFADYLPDYQRDTLALIGNQNPQAILPREIHEGLVQKLLKQEENKDWILDFYASLHHGNDVFNEAQATNVQNIIDSWLEHHPFE